MRERLDASSLRSIAADVEVDPRSDSQWNGFPLEEWGRESAAEHGTSPRARVGVEAARTLSAIRAAVGRAGIDASARIDDASRWGRTVAAPRGDMGLRRFDLQM